MLKKSDIEGKPNQGTRDKAVHSVWELVDKAEAATETLKLLGPDATEAESKALATAEQLINGAVQAALARNDRCQSLYFDEKKAMHESARSAEEEAGAFISRLEREHKVDPKITETRQSIEEAREDFRTNRETKSFEVDYTPDYKRLADEEGD
jgi:hypothetical protein